LSALRVKLARPSARDREEFLRLVRASRDLHRPWVYPPVTDQHYTRYLSKTRAAGYEGFFVRERDTDRIAGVFELSEITRGILQSAYLGFYAMVTHVGRGYMQEGLQLVLRHAFRDLKLHRVEANIQPANKRSIALVRRGGFRKEGLSRRYLKIGGRWRDHERWALLVEDWRPRGRD
jgi:ribosomal-protein-alanine N-acetyltransferase